MLLIWPTAAGALLDVRILSPYPVIKVYGPTPIVATILGTPDVTWSLQLHVGGETHTLASGTGTLTRAAIATLTPAQLVLGQPARIVLTVTPPKGVAVSTETPVLVPDSLFQLIPVEEGNYSVGFLSSAALAGSGNIIAYAPDYSDPQQMLVFDRTTGVRRSLLTSPYDSNSFQLSADGSRLFYQGAFPTSGGRGVGLGYVDLASSRSTLLVLNAGAFYSVSADGRHIIYQGQAGASGAQFFVWDTLSPSPTQITNHPNAIVYDDVGCPRASATRPLLSADGKVAAFISAATLDVAPPDAEIGCRIFQYDVERGGALRYVAGFPLTVNLAFPHLSADGRLLSVLTLPTNDTGVVRTSEALIDMETGAVTDPVVPLQGGAGYDSVIAGDGKNLVLSSQADLDPRVGNADHNLELFLYDLESGDIRQISETVRGIEAGLEDGCETINPRVSDDATVSLFYFHRRSFDACRAARAQRAESTGLSYRLTRAVRKRPGNTPPQFSLPDSMTVMKGDTLRLPLVAVDPDGDPVSLFAQEPGWDDLPAGAQFTDRHDGTAELVWSTNAETVPAREYLLRFVAFDEGGGQTVQDVAVTVVRPSLSCPGDCSGNGDVEINELVAAVSAALTEDTVLCQAADPDSDGRVSIEEIVQAVISALTGCAKG